MRWGYACACVCMILLMALCINGEPFTIKNVNDFIRFADIVHQKNSEKLDAVVDADIDFTGKTVLPVGVTKDTSDCVPFSGVFEGNGHKIINLIMDNSNAGEGYNHAAFFCGLMNARIQNLTIDRSCSFRGAVSASIALNVSGNVTLYNIKNEAEVYGSMYVGGLIAGIKNVNGSSIDIQNTTNAGVVSGKTNGGVGGFIGIIEKNSQTVLNINRSSNEGNCENANRLSDGSPLVGGFIGFVHNNVAMTISIDGIVNNASIRAIRESSSDCLSFSGGLISYIYGNPGLSMTIQNSVNNGQIEAQGFDSYTGGIIGLLIDGNTNAIVNLYNNTNNASITVTNKCQALGGIIGLTRKNERMKCGITDCRNNGTLEQRGTGNVVIGGIIGVFQENASTTVVQHVINNGGIIAGETPTSKRGRIIGYIHDYNNNVGPASVNGIANDGLKFSVNANTNNGALVQEGGGTSAFVGGIIGIINKTGGCSIVINHGINNGDVSTSGKLTTSQTSGIIGYIVSGNSAGLLNVSLMNCENTAIIKSFGTSGGLIGVTDGVAFMINISNSINKGDVIGQTANGIADKVNETNNIVSMGTIQGSAKANTFWNACTQPSAIFYKENICRNCVGDGGIRFHKEGDHYVVSDESHTDMNGEYADVLLNDMCFEQYEYGWTSSLDLVKLCAVSFGDPLDLKLFGFINFPLASAFGLPDNWTKFHWFDRHFTKYDESSIVLGNLDLYAFHIVKFVGECSCEGFVPLSSPLATCTCSTICSFSGHVMKLMETNETIYRDFIVTDDITIKVMNEVEPEKSFVQLLFLMSDSCNEQEFLETVIAFLTENGVSTNDGVVNRQNNGYLLLQFSVAKNAVSTTIDLISSCVDQQ